MDAYIYQAAIYCERCVVEQGIKHGVVSPAARDMPIDRVFEQCLAANGWEGERDYDSDDFPKGPFADGGGEADTPQHCDRCDVFLENPLTAEGYEYLRSIVAEAKRGGDVHGPAEEWVRFYDVNVEDQCDHDWVYTGSAYGGEDESYHGEGRVYCSKCGADGDA